MCRGGTGRLSEVRAAEGRERERERHERERHRSVCACEEGHLGYLTWNAEGLILNIWQICWPLVGRLHFVNIIGFDQMQCQARPGAAGAPAPDQAVGKCTPPALARGSVMWGAIPRPCCAVCHGHCALRTSPLAVVMCRCAEYQPIEAEAGLPAHFFRTPTSHETTWD